MNQYPLRNTYWMSDMKVVLYTASYCKNSEKFKEELEQAGITVGEVVVDNSGNIPTPICEVKDGDVLLRRVVGYPTAGMDRIINLLKNSEGEKLIGKS